MSVTPIPQSCMIVKVKFSGATSFTEISESVTKVTPNDKDRDTAETYTFGSATPFVTAGKHGADSVTIECLYDVGSTPSAHNLVSAAWYSASGCGVADAIVRYYPGSGNNYIEYSGKLVGYKLGPASASNAEPVLFEFTVMGTRSEGTEP